LAADDLRPPALRVMNQNRHIPARAVEVRLDNLQRESGGDAGVKGVASALENAHADRGRNPVRGRNDSKGSLNLGSGRESVRIDKAHYRPVARTRPARFRPQTSKIGYASLWPNQN